MKNMPHKYASKISIFGMPGSGKTTLAKELGVKLNLPVFHLDKLLWNKGWVLRSKQDFLDDHQKILQLNKWIVEGASISTLNTRYPSSNLVIYLNPSRFVCLFRVIKRLFVSKISNHQPSDKPDGCYERITLDFIKYLWGFEKVAIKRIDTLKREYPEIQLIEIKDCKELLIARK
jgi:adenylate kinase family enzyme